MAIVSKQVKVFQARDIEDAFEEKYNYSIELAPLLWPEDFINDCYKSISPKERKEITIWYYMADYGMISEDEWNDYDDVIAKFDFSVMKDGRDRDIIRVCDLLLESGIEENETVLIDVSW